MTSAQELMLNGEVCRIIDLDREDAHPYVYPFRLRSSLIFSVFWARVMPNFCCLQLCQGCISYFHGSRQLMVSKMSGRAGAKKKRNGTAVMRCEVPLLHSSIGCYTNDV